MHQRWDSGTFAKLINEVMAETGLSQQSLARLTGLNPAVISRWRREESRPSYDNVLKLTDALAERYGRQDERRALLFAAAGYGEVPEALRRAVRHLAGDGEHAAADEARGA